MQSRHNLHRTPGICNSSRGIPWFVTSIRPMHLKLSCELSEYASPVLTSRTYITTGTPRSVRTPSIIAFIPSIPPHFSKEANSLCFVLHPTHGGRTRLARRSRSRRCTRRSVQARLTPILDPAPCYFTDSFRFRAFVRHGPHDFLYSRFALLVLPASTRDIDGASAFWHE